MRKTTKVGLLVLLGLCSAIPFGAYYQAQAASTQLESIPRIGASWARSLIQRYPEILWLAGEDVRKTEEGQASASSPYSEQLFGKKYIEFDRTLMTLRCLNLILEGGESAYQAFTAAQSPETKLTRSHFDALHAQGVSLVQSGYKGLSKEEMIQAMEASLVLGDIGKSETARVVFRPYGATAPDHDDFHEEVIQILQEHPSLCPTFNRLPVFAKQLITQSANLAHYGHITHLEGGPDMFLKLHDSQIPSSCPICLSFDLFVHTCDVAGALGHVNNQSSLVYTETTHLGMEAMKRACKELEDPRKTIYDAYDLYIATRAEWLGLNRNDRIDRALTRMGAMLRLSTPEEGQLLKQAVLQLSTPNQEKIIAQLDIQEGNEFGRTPTYMPAVLVNLFNNPTLGSSKEERLAQAVTLGLPFLAKVLEKQRTLLETEAANPQVPLNFNKAAGIAKTTPQALCQEFQIDQEGNVMLTLEN